MNEIEDAGLRETTRDYIVNQQFRRDIFIKGGVPLGLFTARERWQETRFALSINRADAPTKVTGGLGEAAMRGGSLRAVPRRTGLRALRR